MKAYGQSSQTTEILGMNSIKTCAGDENSLDGKAEKDSVHRIGLTIDEVDCCLSVSIGSNAEIQLGIIRGYSESICPMRGFPSYHFEHRVLNFEYRYLDFEHRNLNFEYRVSMPCAWSEHGLWTTKIDFNFFPPRPLEQRCIQTTQNPVSTKSFC